MFIVNFRFRLLIMIFTVSALMLRSATFPPEEKATTLKYEVIPVRIMVEGYDNFYLDVIYTNKKLLFVDIAALFKTLNIPCIADQNGNSLSGLIDTRTYYIDYETKQIKAGDKTIQPITGLLKDKGIFYIESTLFFEIFGINLNFNYRSLSINLKSNIELPAIKQQRIEKMRKNLLKIKGETMTDTLVSRNYHLFRFGTIDWAFGSTLSQRESTSNHFALGVGTELLYGEADLRVNYYDQQKFDNRQLSYQWRWVDNNKPIIKQIQLGTISTQTISFINAPVIGTTITNTPTTIRRAIGYYNIHEYTKPNWNVELYINNVLVDYTTADASGLFNFKVPIIYGYTSIKLKFYGPMGEEQSVEHTINVPYTVMPAKELEYGISAGKVSDSSHSLFSKSEFNYGVNRFITVGGGVEYLSSISNGTTIPFIKATIQPFSKLTINAQYAHGVKTYGMLNYYFKKDVSLEIEYTKYREGQLATPMIAPEERKARLTIPFSHKKIIGYIKTDYTQLVYRDFKYNQVNIMCSAYYNQFSTNTSTQLNWISQKTPFVLSDFSVSYRMGKGYTIQNSIQYNAGNKAITQYKLYIEKYIPKGEISISCERNLTAGSRIINVNYKYDLNFARTNTSVSHQKMKSSNSEDPPKENTIISESAEGSLALRGGHKYIHTTNYTSVGKGGISFYPFLDLNQNGRFDKGEPLVKLSALRIMGNKVKVNEKDTIVNIPDLMAFTQYIVEFKDNDLENTAWRFKKKKYRILIDPNQFKHIDVPIVPIGEIEGMTYINKDNKIKGIGKISVRFYDKNSNRKIAETFSESDGYIRYTGLEPGEYTARIDSVQLYNLHYTTSPKQRDFIIKSLKEGDLVNQIDFMLEPEPEHPTSENKPTDFLKMAFLPEQLTIISELKPYNPNHLLFQNDENFKMVTKDTMIILKPTLLYDVQLYTSHNQINPGDLFTQLIAKIPGIKIMEVLGKDGLYHYSTGVFLNPDEAYQYFQYIMEKGWVFGYVSVYRGGKQKVIVFK